MGHCHSDGRATCLKAAVTTESDEVKAAAMLVTMET
jgi:hypothetical protein